MRYESIVQSVLAAVRFGSSGVMSNIFEIDCGDAEEAGGLWVSKVPPFIKAVFKKRNKSQDFLFILTIDVKHPIGRMDEKLECISLK